MRYRVTFLAGFAAGFVAGTRAGRERYEQMKKAGRKVAESPAVKRATRAAGEKAAELSKVAGHKAAERMPKLTETAKSGAGGASHSSMVSCMATCSWAQHTTICSRFALISELTGTTGAPGVSGSTAGSCTRNTLRSGKTGISSRSSLRVTAPPREANVPHGQHALCRGDLRVQLTIKARYDAVLPAVHPLLPPVSPSSRPVLACPRRAAIVSRHGAG